MFGFSTIYNFAILFLNKATGKDESPGDNADCACGFYYGRHYFGCRIDEPPPPGYKCFCWVIPSIFTCDGTGQKCVSEKEYGCNGCKERQCCIGNCDGYPDRT